MREHMLARYLAKLPIGVLDPAIETLRRQIESKVTCTHLSLAKAILLSFIPALVPSRSNASTFSVAKRAATIVIAISNLIATAKETPKLVETISQLEETLKSIYTFIKSGSQDSTLLSEDEIVFQLSAMKERLGSLLGDFERCIKATPPSTQNNMTTEDLNVHGKEKLATEGSNDHGSHVSFFRDASHVNISGGRFYAISQDSSHIVKTLGVINNRTETVDARLERVEGNQEAMMLLIQNLLGSPQMPKNVSMGFIYLMDATGRRHPVPMTMAISLEQFKEAIRVLFRPETPQGKVLRKSMDIQKYFLSVEDDRDVLPMNNQNDWSEIRPDTMIIMNVVVFRPTVQEGPSRRRCPFCRCWNVIETGSELSSTTCSGCQRRLQKNKASEVRRYQPRLEFSNEEMELISNIYVGAVSSRRTAKIWATEVRKMSQVTRRWIVDQVPISSHTPVEATMASRSALRAMSCRPRSLDPLMIPSHPLSDTVHDLDLLLCVSPELYVPDFPDYFASYAMPAVAQDFDVSLSQSLS